MPYADVEAGRTYARERYYVNREKRLKQARAYKIANPDARKNQYHKNRDTELLNKRKAKAKIQTFIQLEKVKQGCSECGFNTHHAALHWHHPNDDKATTVGHATTMAKAVAEIAKCVVLCANCHAVHHWETRSTKKFEQQLQEHELISLELERKGISII